MDLTILNDTRQNLVNSKLPLAGVMPVDTEKYYIPYDEVIAIFDEVSSIFAELDGRITTNETAITAIAAAIRDLIGRVEALEE